MLCKVALCLMLALVVRSENLDFKTDDELVLHDVVIENNTVGGDINVNGADSGHHGEDYGGDDTDDETESFDDGCSVSGSTVHECDGTQRLMTRSEKIKVRARIARKKMARRSRNSRPSRTAKKSKTRRDVEGGSDPDSPCMTCATGAAFAKKAARKY